LGLWVWGHSCFLVDRLFERHGEGLRQNEINPFKKTAWAAQRHCREHGARHFEVELNEPRSQRLYAGLV
jgi:hypothetical protein